jgi:hypothetical protein
VNEQNLYNYIKDHSLAEDIDFISFSFINFESSSYEKFSYCSNEKNFKKSARNPYYDLASITKPLTIGLIQFLDEQIVKNKNLQLLLKHQSGLPSWGLLSKSTFETQILSYEIKASETLYSDFGAIRAQLEYEKISGNSLYEQCEKIWHDEIKHWSELDHDDCLKTGERSFRPIVGSVHDPNAWTVKRKVSHAGLFGTIVGLSETLIKLEKEYSFLSYFKTKIDNEKGQRFINGWDSVTDKKETLAGSSCGNYTVGHLGFTGTSFWIDCEKKRGVVILTNATRDGWYQKENLNEVRRAIGNLYWEEK